MRCICTHVHHTYVYVQLAAQTDTRSTRTNRTNGLILLPSLADQDEGLSAEMVPCMDRCTCTAGLPLAAALRHPVHPVHPVAAPGSQFPPVAGSWTRVPLQPLVQPASLTAVHTHGRLIAPVMSPTSWSSVIVASARTLACTPALADTGAPGDCARSAVAAQRPPCTRVCMDWSPSPERRVRNGLY